MDFSGHFSAFSEWKSLTEKNFVGITIPGEKTGRIEQIGTVAGEARLRFLARVVHLLGV